MEIGNLVRNGPKVRAAYKRMDDGSVVANRTLEVHIPKRFVENGMAEVTETVWTAAVLGVVIPGECYAPLIAMMDITLMPSSTREVGIKGVAYLVMEFEEGDTLIQNQNVVQDPNKPYQYGMEFNTYAKIPWYMSDTDLSSIFDYAKSQCGRDVGSSPQVSRIQVALQFRDPENLTRAYRHSEAMLKQIPPAIVGLNNSSMLIEGVIPKITGGFLRDNTVAAIVNPDDKVTELEKVIKGVPE